MKHLSTYGTTCWFCGHPAQRTLSLNKNSYRACDRCRKAPITAERGDELKEKVWAALQQDVAALRVGLPHTPVYFTPAEFSELSVHYAGVGRQYAVERLPKEWQDDYAEATKEREAEQRKDYNRRIREQRNNGK